MMRSLIVGFSIICSATAFAQGDDLSRASAAFADKRYSQAEALFTQAARAKASFNAAQRDEWAYCRLHAVAMRLNRETGPMPDAARDIEQAMSGASERLRPFADKLLAEAKRRSPATDTRIATVGATAPAPAPPPIADLDWQTLDSASFRVFYRDREDLAKEVLRTAEEARSAMFKRWHGPAAADWAPRCDVYLHPTSGDYAKATGKPAGPGHATIKLRSGQAVSRRIDLSADEPTLLDGPLPHEITHVVIADLFPDEPLPRWAAIGMAGLSEAPRELARYRQAIAPLYKSRKLFALGPFLESADFPDAEAITAFYAESVSLVAYMVELKGAKAFSTFLREAPRRGLSKALATHYGIKDAADLQERWLRHALAAD